MRESSPPRSLSWLVVAVLAAAFLGGIHWLRAERAVHLSGLPGWSVDAPQLDAASPTGWHGGQRNLVLAQPLADGHQWIAAAQHLLATGEHRVRKVDYDNAPFGRPAFAASPYAWWLAGLAWCDSLITGGPPGRAVERAALYAGPLLQLLILAGSLPWIVRRLGPLAAALFALGVVALYPFAGTFAPGLPDSRSLALVCVLWSLLPLLGVGLGSVTAAQSAAPLPASAPRAPFIVAGLAAAAGLWIETTALLPTVLGLAGGALVAALAVRNSDTATPLLAPAGWRLWGWSLGLGCIAFHFLDYAPGNLRFRPEIVHPLHGLAAIGLGEALAWALPRIARRNPGNDAPGYWRFGAALAAVAALPTAMILTGSAGFSTASLGGLALTHLPPGISARHLGAWAADAGTSLAFWAALTPVLTLAAFLGLCWRRTAPRRATIVLLLGPAVLSAAFACRYLSHFSPLDCALLAVALALFAVPGTAALTGRGWGILAAAAATLVPSLLALAPARQAPSSNDVAAHELQGILERDLAHWLAARTAGQPAVVFAPPDLASALAYYGGLPVVGSMAPENEDGFSGTVRLARASTPEEALALVQHRTITHLVLPSWNRLLDGFAGGGTGADTATAAHNNFLAILNQWQLPLWLRPMAYHIPPSAQLPGAAVMVLSVVEEQEEALAAARLAEYFVESGMQPEAVASVDRLKQFPGDLGAVAALAQIQMAQGDRAGVNTSLEAIRTLLAAGAQESIAWDRRLSVAILLVLAREPELARPLFTRCLAELDEEMLRTLSPSSLMRLFALAKMFRLEFPDAMLRARATELLPPPLRSRI